MNDEPGLFLSFNNPIRYKETKKSARYSEILPWVVVSETLNSWKTPPRWAHTGNPFPIEKWTFERGPLKRMKRVGHSSRQRFFLARLVPGLLAVCLVCCIHLSRFFIDLILIKKKKNAQYWKRVKGLAGYSLSKVCVFIFFFFSAISSADVTVPYTHFL